MENLLFRSSWTSLVFEGRNKYYGAYELRQSYVKHMFWSLLLSVCFIGAGGLLLLLTGDAKTATPLEPSVIVQLTDPVILRDETIYEIPPAAVPRKVLAHNTVPPPATISQTPTDIISGKVEENEPVNPGLTGNTENIPGAGQLDYSAGPETPASVPCTGGNTIPGSEDALTYAEVMPMFSGDLQPWIAARMRYPDAALLAEVEGKMIVELIIDETGKVESARVVRSLGYGCDEEALRVVRNMPDWTPARMGNKPVKVRISIPIKFQLAK